MPFFENGIIGEAGGIEANGNGLLLAHESSWVNPNRNTGTRAEIESKLLEAYGARKMIWAPGIIGADITDYHIDSLARLTGDNTVLIQMPYEISAEDPWSVAALETRKILEAATSVDGQPLIIKTLTEPARTRSKSADFVSAYANYYICNGAIIAPEFGDAEADQACAETLKQLYPGRQIVQLNIDAVGEIGGGIHCATHEQPAIT